MLAVVCGLAAFGVVVAGHSQRQQGRAEAPQQARLAHLVESEQAAVGSLQSAAARLRQQLAHAQQSRSRSSALSQQTTAELAGLAVTAGETALQGPGLVVTLDDAPNVPAGSADADAYRIHDTDLQLVVNALFAAGAEAVSVNGNRVSEVTSIRAAGQTIVVDLTPLLPPYRVTAIGADQRRFTRSAVARRFGEWTSEFGLGFDVSARPAVTVPAFVLRAPLAAAAPQPRGG
ncbi:MAG TPA: DUF881 domain-containing protein [Acidimicrobiales bacterium]|nr:DUF881 domain-containing protein [Acidimicrobiales bacterium]